MAFRVCFVCIGNICRSPMAAAVMLRLLSRAGRGADVEVSSAGTGGWHVGEGADPRAQDVLTRHGYDASEHKARQFTRRWFDEFDLVLAVDRETLSNLRNIAPPNADGKLRLLREFDPQAGRDLDVPDPYYGGQRGFDEVLAMVERSCEGVARAAAGSADRNELISRESGVQVHVVPAVRVPCLLAQDSLSSEPCFGRNSTRRPIERRVPEFEAAKTDGIEHPLAANEQGPWSNVVAAGLCNYPVRRFGYSIREIECLEADMADQLCLAQHGPADSGARYPSLPHRGDPLDSFDLG